MLNLAVPIATTRQTEQTRAEGIGTVIFVPAQAESKTMSCFVILVYVYSYPFLYLYDVCTFGVSLHGLV